MKIKMLVSFSGGWSCSPGEIVERPDDEAVRLVDRGYAEPVEAASSEAAIPGDHQQEQSKTKRRKAGG